MSDLRGRISDAIKTAMKARDKPRVGVLRLISSEIKRIEVDERRELPDADVIAVLNKMLKQRNDSESQFRAAGRVDLADQEAFEITLIKEFMPDALGEAQLDELIRGAIAASGATSMRDMGKVMSVLRETVAGRADMSVVSARVKACSRPDRVGSGVRLGRRTKRAIHCPMAGRIPQTFINDLLSRIDIVDVVDSRLTLRKTGRNFQALCPFHDEKTASFSVNPEKQFYYCFGCHATGTALTFLMEYDHLEFVAAVEALASIAGVEVPREAGARGGRRTTRSVAQGSGRGRQVFPSDVAGASRRAASGRLSEEAWSHRDHRA